MGSPENLLACDGCGLPASPEHIADRLRRLELSTRFRPVHIGILFVALAPPVRAEDDFYGPPESKEFFDPFLEALEIYTSTDRAALGSDAPAADMARLVEFQHRGYYLACLSECPIGNGVELANSTIARLSPTLIRRIRLNYKPKQIAILGSELAPLPDIFNKAGIPATSLSILGIPRAGDAAGTAKFRAAITNPPYINNASV